MDLENYRKVFYPESIVLVGASASPFKFGGLFLQAQLSFGFKGKIYPVNPKGGEISGLKVYKSILDISAPIDLAVITVPAEQVIQAVEDCISIGVKGIQVITAGFRELSASGRDLEFKIVERTKVASVKLIGPNCFGVYSPKVGLTLIPGTEFPREKGKVGLFSQSGGGACDVVLQSYGRSVRFSVVVSFGNAAGIGPEEMLEYFADDEDTEIVGAYIEGIEDGPRFRKALKACASKKPVVILKVGLTELGQKGTVGHTGSMAGSRAVWESVIKSCGAIAAHNLRDLSECLMALQCLKHFQGRNAGVLTGGGARVVEALDAADDHGFKVPDLNSETKQVIQSLLPETGSGAGNPVDLANPILIPGVINAAMEALAGLDEIDFLLLHQILFYSLSFHQQANSSESEIFDSLKEQHQEIAAKASAIAKATGKQLVIVLADIASDTVHIDLEKGRLIARKFYTSKGIPCFDSTEQAFSVLARISETYRRKTE